MAKIKFITFGKYKSGWVSGKSLYVDCRRLPDPSSGGLSHVNGQHPKAKRWILDRVQRWPDKRAWFNTVFNTVAERIRKAVAENETNYTVAFYCAGGRHRSVFFSEYVAEQMRKEQITVEVQHLDMRRRNALIGFHMGNRGLWRN